MNKKMVLFLIHIPVWIVVLSLVFLMNSDAKHLNSTTFLILQSLTHTFWLLSGFYVFFLYLVPKHLETGNYRTFTLLSGFFVLILIPGITLLFNNLSAQLAGLRNLGPSYPVLEKMIFAWMGGSLGAIVCGGLGTFYRLGLDWFKNLQIKKDLENKNLQSELRTLKSKLNPHLLFNTLNNIDTLIQTSPEQASNALSKLSDLLRYVVYDTDKEMVSIQKEIENLQKYIDLEKIRLVNPDSVKFEIKVKNDIAIPPMIFFPYVENGFKHSNLNNSNQSLIISITQEKNRILFSCINTVNDNAEKKSDSGLGLELAKKRLDLLYPNSHKLTIERVDNKFHVNIEIEI